MKDPLKKVRCIFEKAFFAVSFVRCRDFCVHHQNLTSVQFSVMGSRTPAVAGLQ